MALIDRTRAWASPARATLVAQIAQSASGLACMAIVLMLSPSAEFGAFALAQAAALLALGVVDSAFLVPLLVLCARPSASPRPADARRFDGSTLAGSVAACIAVALGFRLLLPLLAPSTDDHDMLALAVAVWALALVARDWLRQRQLLGQRYRALVLCDLAAGLASVLAVSALAWSMSAESIPVPSMVLACAAVGLLPAILLAVHPAIRLRPTAWHWREYAHAGGWSFASSQITWLQSQSYLFFASSILGTAAAGTIAATRLVFAPAQTVVTGLSRGWLAELAGTRGTGHLEVARRLLRRSLPALAVTFGAWTVAGILAFDLARGLLVERGYDAGAGLVLAWGLAMLCSCARAVVTQIHRSRGAFRFLAAQGALGAVLSVVGVVTGALLAGAPGVVAGLALAEGAALAWGLGRINRVPEAP